MPDDEMITERPSRRAAATLDPPVKRYRVLKTIVVREEKFRPGDVIDSTHPKLNYAFCLSAGALEEVV